MAAGLAHGRYPGCLGVARRNMESIGIQVATEAPFWYNRAGMDASIGALRLPVAFEMVDRLETVDRSGSGVRFAEAVAVSFLVGLSAQLEVRMPFTPVPITGQSFAVLLAGAVLGSRWGALSIALYLLEGSFGLPFFAGGATGLVHLFGPTRGYLLGFLLGSWVVGLLAERGWDRTPWTAAAMMGIGSAVIFGCGLAGLLRFVGSQQLLAIGLYPFLLGDAFKILLAAGLLPLIRRWGPPTDRGSR